MKSVCVNCGKTATVTCKCSAQTFCQECFCSHAADSATEHESEAVTETEALIAIAPALKKKQNQARGVLEALKDMQEQINLQIETTEGIVEGVNTFSQNHPEINHDHHRYIQELTESLQCLESRVSSAYRAFLMSMDNPIAARVASATPDSQVAALEAKVKEISEENDRLQYEINLMMRSQREEEVMLLKEKMAEVAQKNKRLKRSNAKFLEKIAALEGANRLLEQEKLSLHADLVAAKQEEEERKEKSAQEQVAAPSVARLSLASAVCEYCKKPNSADADWRGRALVETPEMASIIPDLCSHDCFLAMQKQVRGPSFFLSFLIGK